MQYSCCLVLYYPPHTYPLLCIVNPNYARTHSTLDTQTPSALVLSCLMVLPLCILLYHWCSGATYLVQFLYPVCILQSTPNSVCSFLKFEVAIGSSNLLMNTHMSTHTYMHAQTRIRTHTPLSLFLTCSLPLSMYTFSRFMQVRRKSIQLQVIL